MTPNTDTTTARATPTGIRRWLTTLDHRDIGRLYLMFGTIAGLWAGTDAMAIRTELLAAGWAVWEPGTYAAFFTTHGLTMLFFFVTPVAFGFANYLVPLLIDAEDMAFPRLNAIAFWLLPPALLLARSGTLLQLLGFAGISPPETGWTFYPPLSVIERNVGVDLVLLGLHLSGVSTLASAINLIATVFCEREGVSWAELDVFTWSVLVTSGLVLFAFPMLGSAIIMLLLDRNVGTVFYAIEGGGPLLFQHLFWFFGHPEVYILVLPPMGIVSYVLPKFSGRRLFGFRYVVYSTLAIGVLSFGVWAHHMFTTGIDPRIQASFMAVSLAIAIPSAVKTFNWIATLWGGRIRLEAPMLFCLGAISLFIVGGVTGVFLAAVPVDRVYHGTYYVVGHFHFLLVGFVVCALFAAGYYWFPLVTGRRYDPALARMHFLLTIGGTVLAFTAVTVLGIQGLPRRMATYPPRFETLQQIATIGAYVIGFGQLCWLVNVCWSALWGSRAGEDPWRFQRDGMRAREWKPMTGNEMRSKDGRSKCESAINGAGTAPDRGNHGRDDTSEE